MIVNNLPPNLLKILSGEGLSNLTSLFQHLKNGQIFQGTVAHVLDDGKAVIEFEGKQFLADTQTSLNKGQTLNLKLDYSSRAPVLKIVASPSLPPSGNDRELDVSHVTSRRNGTIPDTAASDKPSASPPTRISSPQLPLGKNISPEAVKSFHNNSTSVKAEGPVLQVAPDKISVPAGIPGIRTEFSPDSLPQINPRTPNISVEMIKPYLASRQPFGEMIATIGKIADTDPVLKQLVDSGLLERLRNTLDVLGPRDSLPTANQIKEQIDLSGLRYESKLKHHLVDSRTASPASEKEISGDLKGQLLQIRNTLEALTLKEISSLPLRQVSELVQTFRQAVDSIELNQLTHQMSKQENQSLLFQLQNPFSQNDKTIKVYYRGVDEKGYDGKGKGGKSYKLAFFLDLTQLGAVRIDTQVMDTDVNVNISVESEAIAIFFETFFPGFQEKMLQEGFNLTISSTVKQAEELKAEDIFHKLLVDQSTRLVDVQT